MLRRHVSRGGPDGILSWSTIGTKLTVVKLTTVSLQDASAELTRISLLDLKVVCQQKGIQTESLLTVGLGLLRAYRRASGGCIASCPAHPTHQLPSTMTGYTYDSNAAMCWAWL